MTGTSASAGPGARGRLDPDRLIHDLAGRQQGVVSRAQLLAGGVAGHVVDHRLKQGRLERLHRGVYRVGPLRGRYEREMAAVLACGDTAVLSHRSAATLWALLPSPPPGSPTDVIIRRGNRSRRSPLVRAHRVPGLRDDEITARHGIPITTPERTVLDLAAVSSGREVEQALARGERGGSLNQERLKALLSRHQGRPGTPALRALLTADASPALTRSEAEERLLRLVRRARLEPPETNVVVCGYEVDFLWRRARLVVEVDGRAFHSGDGSFEGDRHRDAVLVAAGFRVVRLTWKRLTEEPEAVLADLVEMLVRGPGWTP